jgi:hypothetical protein
LPGEIEDAVDLDIGEQPYIDHPGQRLIPLWGMV